MVDFKQAVQWMKEGKKVLRKPWNMYIRSKGGLTIVKSLATSKEREFTYLIEDFEATDWEIYKEEDNWSITDCFFTFFEEDCNQMRGNRLLEAREIKTLKEKILEDEIELLNLLRRNLSGCNLNSRQVEEVSYHINSFSAELGQIKDKRFGDLK